MGDEFSDLGHTGRRHAYSGIAMLQFFPLYFLRRQISLDSTKWCDRFLRQHKDCNPNRSLRGPGEAESEASFDGKDFKTILDALKMMKEFELTVAELYRTCHWV